MKRLLDLRKMHGRIPNMLSGNYGPNHVYRSSAPLFDKQPDSKSYTTSTQSPEEQDYSGSNSARLNYLKQLGGNKHARAEFDVSPSYGEDGPTVDPSLKLGVGYQNPKTKLLTELGINVSSDPSVYFKQDNRLEEGVEGEEMTLAIGLDGIPRLQDSRFKSHPRSKDANESLNLYNQTFTQENYDQISAKKQSSIFQSIEEEISDPLSDYHPDTVLQEFLTSAEAKEGIHQSTRKELQEQFTAASKERGMRVFSEQAYRRMNQNDAVKKQQMLDSLSYIGE